MNLFLAQHCISYVVICIPFEQPLSLLLVYSALSALESRRLQARSDLGVIYARISKPHSADERFGRSSACVGDGDSRERSLLVVHRTFCVLAQEKMFDIREAQGEWVYIKRGKGLEAGGRPTSNGREPVHAAAFTALPIRARNDLERVMIG